MSAWFDRVMTRRARNLTHRLGDWIPPGSRVADIGSGTGHNATAWRSELAATVDEFDVADLHWVGAGPRIFDGLQIPAANAAYSVVTVLFVLHYSPQPVELLCEAGRISSGRVLVIQSTYRGLWGRLCLNVRGMIWGPVAFLVARLVGMLKGGSCPLISRTLFSREELSRVFQQAGLTVQHWEPQEWWGLMISRDLYVLEISPRPVICPSSSPPAMKSVG